VYHSSSMSLFRVAIYVVLYSVIWLMGIGSNYKIIKTHSSCFVWNWINSSILFSSLFNPKFDKALSKNVLYKATTYAVCGSMPLRLWPKYQRVTLAYIFQNFIIAEFHQRRGTISVLAKICKSTWLFTLMLIRIYVCVLSVTFVWV